MIAVYSLLIYFGIGFSMGLIVFWNNLFRKFECLEAWSYIGCSCITWPIALYATIKSENKKQNERKIKHSTNKPIIR